MAGAFPAEVAGCGRRRSPCQPSRAGGARWASEPAPDTGGEARLDHRYAPDWRRLERPGTHAAEAAPVLASRRRVEAGGERAAAYVAAFAPRPPIVDRDVEVAALRLGRGGATDEHAAGEPILVLVVAGARRTRVGGSAGVWHALGPGDAMLWPEGVLPALETRGSGRGVRFVHPGRMP